MLKKTFILTQFGSPHPWTEEYFKNIAVLGRYGWHWKIFTPNTFQNVPPNVEIIPLTIDQFDSLIATHCSVDPQNFLSNGVPDKPVSDFYVAAGQIFKNFLQDSDYWGITNWDVVYGRLDHFLSDEELGKWDVWTDDVNIINGVFCLWKNDAVINNLFREIPDWQMKFTNHRLFGTDEYDMTSVMRLIASQGRAKYGYPPYYPLHSYDRLEQHVPLPKLEFQDDGSLWERFQDVEPPKGYINFPKGYIAREIMYFHFSYTKKYPVIPYNL